MGFTKEDLEEIYKDLRFCSKKDEQRILDNARHRFMRLGLRFPDLQRVFLIAQGVGAQWSKKQRKLCKELRRNLLLYFIITSICDYYKINRFHICALYSESVIRGKNKQFRRQWNRFAVSMEKAQEKYTNLAVLDEETVWSVYNNKRYLVGQKLLEAWRLLQGAKVQYE